MIARRVFLRDLRIAPRRGGGLFATLGFCLMVFCAFAFSLGPEALHAVAPRVLVTCVLLSLLLALPNLFERDDEDGTLEQYLLAPGALEWLVLAKLAAFWLTAALPLILLAPLLALMADLSGEAMCTLLITLALSTPTLCAVGALSAALTLGIRRSGITQALIVLPLYIPPLIFAAGADMQGAGTLLAAMALIAVPVSCLLSAVLLRITVE